MEYNAFYLKELGEGAMPFSYRNPEDKRSKAWAQQRMDYGFDETETWNLDAIFYAWLYEHLRMYVDVADSVVDLEYHKFVWEGREYTQRQLIDEMLTRIKYFFSEDYDEWKPVDFDYTNKIGEIWAIVLPAMWW